jgi:hypothetical protein
MKAFFVMAFLLLAGHAVFSQRSLPIALNLYGGYTFPDHVDLGSYNSYSDHGYIQGAGQYGAGLEFFMDKRRSLELTYLYMGTHAQFYDWEGQTNPNNDKASLNYIMIGGNNYFPTRSNVWPFFGASIGVGIADFNYYDQGSTTATKFAWNVRFGVKIKTQSVVSIKLQAWLQSIAQGVGVGVGFGTGGIGAGVSTYSSMLQFGLGGVLSFGLGGKNGGR